MNTNVKSKRTQKRYSPELKERAVRLVMQLRAETGEKPGSVKRIADNSNVLTHQLAASEAETSFMKVSSRVSR